MSCIMCVGSSVIPIFIWNDQQPTILANNNHHSITRHQPIHPLILFILVSFTIALDNSDRAENREQ